MATILSIETATRSCSVALHFGGELAACQELFVEKSHSTHLAILIEQLLNNCKIKMEDLDAVAVSKGPGSYTGLRIGVATAKGLCYGLGIPLIGVNSLTAMAHQFRASPPVADFLCPMIDARRMEVYCMVLNGDLDVVADTQAVIVEEDSFEEWRKLGKVLFFGNGSEKCRDLLNGTGSIFVGQVEPSARTVGLLATEKYRNGQTEDLAYFEPFYLKDFRTTVPKDKTGIINEIK